MTTPTKPPDPAADPHTDGSDMPASPNECVPSATDLHPLRWERDFDPITYLPQLEAMVGAEVPYGTEAVAVAELWAARLGLTATDRGAMSGQRTWEGDALDHIEMQRVRLWCIADEAAWNAAVAELERQPTHRRLPESPPPNSDR